MRKDFTYKRLTAHPGSLPKHLKTRKKSDSKLSSLNYADSHSNAPSLNTSSALATSFSSSYYNFNTSDLGPLKSSSKAAKKDRSILPSEVMQLENQLTERLAAVKSTEARNSDRFKVYQNIFDEVIHRDDRFGSLLKKIKLAYEDWHNTDNRQALTARLEADLNEKIEELSRSKREHTQLNKKVSKLSKENGELSRSLEETETRYLDLQDRLLKLTQVKCDNVPKDETSWQYLVSENKYYAEAFKTLKRDLKVMKRREDKLLKLVFILKKEGYPVEQIYKEECRRNKLAKLPYKEVKGSDAPDEEVEPLVHGPPKAVERPKAVPQLSFNTIEPDLTSESESGTEYSDSAVSSAVSSSNSIGQKPSIPKLSLSNGPDPGFHEEFMSRIDEFSESWRKQIELERR